MTTINTLAPMPPICTPPTPPCAVDHHDQLGLVLALLPHGVCQWVHLQTLRPCTPTHTNHPTPPPPPPSPPPSAAAAHSRCVHPPILHPFTLMLPPRTSSLVLGLYFWSGTCYYGLAALIMVPLLLLLQVGSGLGSGSGLGVRSGGQGDIQP